MALPGIDRALIGARAPSPQPSRLVFFRGQKSEDLLRRSRALLVGSGVLFLAACTTPSTPPPQRETVRPAAPVSGLAALDYAGDQSALIDLTKTIAAAGRDQVKIDALSAELVALLEQPGTTFAARQAICERLGGLLSGQSVPAVLAHMLSDEKEFNLARLALEPVPGPAVDNAFIDAMNRSAGVTRIALIHSLAHRRASGAVSQLGLLASDGDPAIAAAAVAALGKIGGSDALDALRSTATPTAPPLVAAQLECVQRLPVGQAKIVLSQLYENPRVLSHQRAAAFCLLLPLEPESAIARIPAAIQGENAALRRAALGAIAAAASNELNALLLAKLGTYDLPTQAAIVTALGRCGDATVVPGVSAAVTHPDSAVRTAAVEALGRLPGKAETVVLLAQVAKNDGHDGKLARQSLTRLNGDGVDRALSEGAEKGDPATRAVFIEQLAARNMTESLPLLLGFRQDPDLSVRLATLAALGEFAPFAEQAAILEWVASADDSEEQSRALRTLISVTQRGAEVNTRVLPVIAKLERADRPVQLRLLRVLPRVGGSAAADTAARFAVQQDLELAEAAGAALARWTDAEAVAPLVFVAEQSPHEKIRADAVEAALELLDKNRGIESTARSNALARLLAVTPTLETRERVLFLLGRCNDATALALAEKLQSDPALAGAAAEAALAIRANQLSPAVTASANPPDPKLLLDGKSDAQWAVPASAGQWIQLDYQRSRPIRRITLEQKLRSDLFPEAYAVFVTDNPQQPGLARVSGSGSSGPQTVIELPAGTQGRYVIIKHTADKKDASWSVTEILTD